MSISGAGFKYDPEWRITVFTVLLVPLMVSLGFWQLQRADEKAALSAAFEQRQAQRPAPLSDLLAIPMQSLAYTPTRLSGRFLRDEYFLLDNRMYNGRFGYEVLSILQLDGDGGVALVNRGWVAGDASRRELPQVPPVPGQVSVTGHVYVAPGAPYLLAEQQLQGPWPKVIQAVEMDKLQPLVTPNTEGDVYPYSVRINADSPGALRVDWKIVNVSPQKHHGYALQWFAMAAVLFIFYLLRCSNLWPLLQARLGNRD